MIRVLVVDDQTQTRRALRVLLSGHADINVVAEAGSGPDAVALASVVHPDVVLMDVRMPDGDGIAATRQLAGQGTAKPIPVVIITTFDLDEYIFGALEAGAAGFLLKSSSAEDLANAVRAAANGDGLVSPAITRRVIAEFARRGQTAGTPSSEIAMLTARELEIVRALAEGQSNLQIAAALNIEQGTVKSHLARITQKLDVENRVQVVVWAFHNGIAR